MKTTKGSLILLGALAMAGASHAISADAGTTAVNLLTVQTAARPAAMANAFTAVGDDINSFYRNPAGLGYMRSSEAMAGGFSGFEGTDAKTVSIAIPLGDVNTSNVRPLGTLAVGIGTLDYGKTPLTDTTGATLGDFSASDEMLMVGWGKTFGGVGAIGANAKLYKIKIFDQSGTGTLIDVGAMYRVVPNVLTIGALAANLGDSITYESVGSDAPTTYSAGAALTPFTNNRLMVTMDIEKPADASSAVKTGVEWMPASALALRAGYDSSYDAGSGVSLGAGINLLNLEVGFFPVDRVSLDYAFTPGDDLEYNHRVSLSCRIGTQ